MKKNPLPLFFLLTFALTWTMWLPAALTKLNGADETCQVWRINLRRST